MFFVPLSVIFSWPLPNYIDPVTRGHTTVIVSVFFFSVATLFVGARLYQRIFVRRWFGPDDLFIILGFVSCLLRVGILIETDIQSRSYCNHRSW
jgi:hypothetical protein